MTAPVDTAGIRGKLTADAPLAKLVWFKSGGAADWLFEPADAEDLKEFLQRLEGNLPVMALGLGSNLIVRDGGVPGAEDALFEVKKLIGTVRFDKVVWTNTWN